MGGISKGWGPSHLPREKYTRYNDTRQFLKGIPMKDTLKGLARKVVENRSTIIKYTLIGIGSVAGLVVGAGLVSKGVSEVEDVLADDDSQS